MNKLLSQGSALVLGAVISTASIAEEASSVPMVKRGVASVEVQLDDKTCVIERVNKKGNQVHEMYALTGQGTPQPMSIATGIETLGEIEFIDYMSQASIDDSILVLDTRTENWHNWLRIPCTTNVSYKAFGDDRDEALFYLTEMFGVIEKDDGSLDFSEAKTLVGYCNGYWCGQTPSMFKRAKNSLVNLGYPVEKLKYYRGGMQAWVSLGLTVEGERAQ